MDRSFISQIKDNAIALASLLVAIVALAHTSWRYAHMEKNQNIRVAGFEVLLNLGQLQQVVNASYYDPKNSLANPMLGWGNIALIGDLSELIPDPAPQAANKLLDTWKANFSKIQKDEAAVEKVSSDIDKSREAVLQVLKQLD